MKDEQLARTMREIIDMAEVFVIEKNYIHSGLADRPRIISWIAEFAVAHANDAIADTKAFYESLFAELKQSDRELVEIYAQAEVGRLQAEKRNAALVAALEEIQGSAKNEVNIGLSLFRKRALDIAKNAIEAHKKGCDNA